MTGTDLVIRNSVLQATISLRGAELVSLRTRRGEWIWPGDESSWPRQAPLLFPVVGRSPNGRVRVHGRDHPMAIHGFAATETFEPILVSPDRCRLRLTANSRTRLAYPFEFALTLDFHIEESDLRITAGIDNPGQEPLPYSFGLHPGFTLPIPGGSGPHRIVFDDGAQPKARALSRAGLLLSPVEALPIGPEGGFALQRASFDAGAKILVSDFGSAVCLVDETGTGVRVSSPDATSLGLWTLPGQPFVCLEPWIGLPPFEGGSDRLEDRPGSRRLAPGGADRLRFMISILDDQPADEPSIAAGS